MNNSNHDNHNDDGSDRNSNNGTTVSIIMTKTHDNGSNRYDGNDKYNFFSRYKTLLDTSWIYSGNQSYWKKEKHCFWCGSVTRRRRTLRRHRNPRRMAPLCCLRCETDQMRPVGPKPRRGRCSLWRERWTPERHPSWPLWCCDSVRRGERGTSHGG